MFDICPPSPRPSPPGEGEHLLLMGDTKGPDYRNDSDVSSRRKGELTWGAVWGQLMKINVMKKLILILVLAAFAGSVMRTEVQAAPGAPIIQVKALKKHHKKHKKHHHKKKKATF
jgi:hypothetical protein